MEEVTQRYALYIGSRASGQRRKRAPKARRSNVGARLFELGVAPDRWGRWKVETVMEVRRTRSGDRGRAARGLEVRVRWAGLNPATGLPWKAEWRAMRDASGWVGNAALREEALEMERIKYGADVPTAEANSRATEGRKWVGAPWRGKRHWTRTRTAEHIEAEGWSLPRKRACTVINEEDRAVDIKADALRDARLKYGGRRSAKRRRAIVDSSSDDE